MNKIIISYSFNSAAVANPDGSYPTTLTGVTVTNGPGKMTFGTFDKALDLGNAGKGVVELTGLRPDQSRFCIRICFRATGPVTSRQNLAESNLLSFSLHLVPGSDSSKFLLNATVSNLAHGWNGPSTRFKKELTIGKWYTATFAYDLDTAALFVDGEILGVYAFPKGALSKGTGTNLFFGTWTDGARDHFNGALAAFEWHDGIPDDLQSAVDDQRGLAEWFITRKFEAVGRSLNLGTASQGILFDAVTGAHIQHYANGAIMYHDTIGIAFEIHGAIYTFYKGWNKRSSLGFLVSDQVPASNAAGRKSLFSRGAIYWSAGTGAVPALDQIYVDYEALGESATLGFPTKAATAVPGGQEQLFQGARMYHRAGEAHAFEVHGAILAKYLAPGGVRKWGFPVTNESDVRKGTTQVLGKFSEFEDCTIYWSPSSGAWEVHGDIQKKYDEIKGPIGDLGFPTSDERDIPGVSGAGRMNTFQKGSILWYGNYNSIVVARPFKIYLGRLSTKESEGFGMGQNDIYVKVTVKEGSSVVFDKRRPSSGDWGGHNIKDINYTIPNEFLPNNPNKVVWYRLKAWDADPGNDDYLGEVSKTLNASNAWGLRENNGTFTLGPTSKIRSFTTSVRPTIDPKSLTASEKWWGAQNQGTPDISWQKHAQCFRDVDSDTEWWDITDWVDKAFYELVTKDIAENGNCFGMSLESIYALKFSSIFSLPLCNYTNWNGIVNEINVKHCYQAGAEAIYWFLGQFLGGNTHDPKGVFNNSRNAFLQGRNPVLCVAQKYDFSGEPHCILPVAWDSSSKPWRITICDPNSPANPCSINATKVLTFYPDQNTFNYLNKYKGGEWTGGRLYYIPFDVLNRHPRTPVWDLILLILAGTIIILGEDADTTSITDESGKDLSAFSARAATELQAKHRPEEFFLGFKGFDRPAKPGPGNILLRKETASITPGNAGTGSFTRMTLGNLLGHQWLRTAATALKGKQNLLLRLKGRTPHSVAADPALMGEMPPDAKKAIENITAANAARNFIHKIKGRKSGKFDYLFKHQFTEVKIESTLSVNDIHNVAMRDVGTSKQTMRLDTSKNKTVKVIVDKKLGAKGDRARFTLNSLPLQATKGLSFNFKPGLGDIEVIAPGMVMKVPVKFEAAVGKQKIIRNFNLPLDGGARIRISSLLEENALFFGKIDCVFGPVLATGVVKGR
jgi:hypothetical protein